MKPDKKNYWIYVHPEATVTGTACYLNPKDAKLLKEDINYLIERHGDQIVTIMDREDPSKVSSLMPAPRRVEKAIVFGAFAQTCVALQIISLVSQGYDVDIDLDCIVPGTGKLPYTTVDDFTQKHPGYAHLMQKLGF